MTLSDALWDTILILLGFDPANCEMSKIYQGNLQSLCRLAQLFLNTSAVISKRKSKIVGGIFFPALEMQFGQFY